MQMHIYTEEDCGNTGYGISLKAKVVVVSPDALPGNHPEQLFFCTGEDSIENPESAREEVSVVSLTCGERFRFQRKDIMGTLKPDLLPEEAKLQLSQIRPSGGEFPGKQDPEYCGYCFLPDGRYASGVWLSTPDEVEDYLEMQMDYQYRILICDRNDMAVIDVVDNETVFQELRENDMLQRKPENMVELG